MEKLSIFVKKHPALSMLVLGLALGLTPVLLVLAGVLSGGFLQLGAVSGSAAGGRSGRPFVPGLR